MKIDGGLDGKDIMICNTYGCLWAPQIIHFNRVFHYKPSILGYPYFWKHPYIYIYILFFNIHYIFVISEKPSAKILGKVPEMQEIEGLQYVKVHEEKNMQSPDIPKSEYLQFIV